MTVITAYIVPKEHLAIGRASVPEVAVELEDVVIHDRTTVQYFWVDGPGQGLFRRALRRDPVIEDLSLIDDFADRRFYRGRADPDGESFLWAVLEHGVDVLRATGGEDWMFVLSFDDRDHRAAFEIAAEDRFVSRQRGYGLTDETTTANLTRRQHEALAAAYEHGYFDIPRRTTLVDLAGRLGISDQAVSERMRRGESKLVETYLPDTRES